MTAPLPADALDAHVELRTTLAMAAGTAAKLFEYVEPGRDTVRLAIALYSEYAAATDRVWKKFLDPHERRARHLQPRKRPRPAQSVMP